MLGNWKSSLVLGLFAVSLWAFAFAWYFIGNHRIGLAWQRFLARLGLGPAAPEKPGRRRPQN